MSTLDLLSTAEHSPAEWAVLIRADLGYAVAGFVNAGQHLIQAKAEIPHGDWERWVRDEVGISPGTARMLMLVAEHPVLANRYHGNDLPPSWRTLYELSQLEPPFLEAAITAGRVHPDLERDDARKLVIEYKQIAAEVHFVVRHGSFADAAIADESVAAIITDPPYPEEFLPLYAALAERAAAWLKPGGVCAVMCGQSYLPRIHNLMGEYLTYHWTLAYLTPGPTTALYERELNSAWKPVVVYKRPGPLTAKWWTDVARSDLEDKRFHHWGQSEGGMADILRRLTHPGDLVLDPFMGAGTTGVAAIALGRSFVGYDVDEDACAVAQQRLEETVLERLG